MISAKVILDSMNPCGDRLITMELCYPRFIHSELMTYRMLSRNAASSRAIPAKKLRERTLASPALPVWWGQNEKGMQAREELSLEDQAIVKETWLGALSFMAEVHEELEKAGLHKQLLNRLLEPWMEITVICTANEAAYQHLFFERCHPDAQPEFQSLALSMREALRRSTPQRLAVGDWHTPYLDLEDLRALAELKINKSHPWNNNPYLCQISAARCARVSYLTHEGKRDIQEDLLLFLKLVPAEEDPRPGHWSPLEHVAQALGASEVHGNFKGWMQYRKFFSRENSLEET